MKKLMRKIAERANELTLRAKLVVETKRAEMYVDKGVGIIIAVVVGALLLAGVYTLFDATILPKVTAKINEMFNYGG